jgi:hypothetical protein
MTYSNEPTAFYIDAYNRDFASVNIKTLYSYPLVGINFTNLHTITVYLDTYDTATLIEAIIRVKSNGPIIMNALDLNENIIDNLVVSYQFS